jgi:hypothetical protein
MSKTWKWVLGILAVLVIVVVLVGLGFLWRYNTQARFAMAGLPGHDWDGRGIQRMPMGGFHQPGMMGRGGYYSPYSMGFLFIGAFFRFLIPLGLVALVAWGAYAWGKRSHTGTAATAVVETHPCVKCGEPVQEGWKHCPNCGKKQ